MDWAGELTAGFTGDLNGGLGNVKAVHLGLLSESSGKAIASVMDKKMNRAIFSLRSFLTTEGVFVNRFALSTGSLICS